MGEGVEEGDKAGELGFVGEAEGDAAFARAVAGEAYGGAEGGGEVVFQQIEIVRADGCLFLGGGFVGFGESLFLSLLPVFPDSQGYHWLPVFHGK